MRVGIIGGGAAGLMAAVSAADMGYEVTIIEKNNILGKKLLITGKGRCNVTNNTDINGLIKNIPVNARFLYSAFNTFSSEDTMAYFENMGVSLKTERGNRVFPSSDRSADIVNALKKSVKNNGVKIINDTVTKIISEDNTAHGVECSKLGFLKFDKIIIATGGKSYSSTGSTGDGYKFAEDLGIEVTQLKPSLVPIKIKEGFCKNMQGLSLKNVVLSVFDKKLEKNIFSEMGEMIFTHFGISGPLVLSASSHIRNIEQDRYEIFIDLKPALDDKKLDARILRDFNDNLNKNFINVIRLLVPQKMTGTIAKLSGISVEAKINSITKEDRLRLVSILKNFKMTAKGFMPIEDAIITSGGINIKEVNPKTMESKKINGLYFAGEVIDVDGYTGGFNLQIAFSTGYLAGKCY